MDQLTKLLRKMRDLDASDLILCAGTPPAFRVHGSLIPRDDQKPLSNQHIEKMLQLILIGDQLKQFKQEKETNLSIALPDLGRFRINIYQQRKQISLAIRAIPRDIPSFNDLRLPDILKDIAMQKSGLIIISGAAGAGKSTSMAAMIDHRNKNEQGHIITIEDPMEYDIAHAKSVISQREIGVDTDTYAKALVNVLRQSPDVLMIGEIRDKQTLDHVLEFAETGHLCMTTIHASNTTQTFERIVNMYPEEQRDAVLNTLASNFKAILSQRLIPDVNGELVLAYELLLPTPRTIDLISRGELWELRESLDKSTGSGMQSLDQTLFELVKENRISQETAVKHASSVNNLRLRMKLENKVQPISEELRH